MEWRPSVWCLGCGAQKAPALTPAYLGTWQPEGATYLWNGEMTARVSWGNPTRHRACTQWDPRLFSHTPQWHLSRFPQSWESGVLETMPGFIGFHGLQIFTDRGLWKQTEPSKWPNPLPHTQTAPNTNTHLQSHAHRYTQTHSRVNKHKSGNRHSHI